jgi:hypothetical protein
LNSRVATRKKKIDLLMVKLTKIQENLTQAQLVSKKIQEIKAPFLKNILKIDNQLPDELLQMRKKISQAQKFLSLSPDLLAFNSKKKYLILLQNNMELRPTGGFIGSYGILSLEKGRFLDLSIKDVYDADGQLKGHVEPPKAIKQYLGEANWYLRDSNFSPDFPTAAAQAEWFLQKETGDSVDATIAINLNLIKSLLEITGPIQVLDYNETISAENLFERTEFHSEKDFFPGSIQKKSFLTALSGSLLEKLKNLTFLQTTDFLFSLYEAGEKKELLFYFHDKALQARIKALGWTGEVKNINFGAAGEFKGPGIIDYLMLAEANLGVNKVNYFLERKVNLETSLLDDGQIVDQLRIIYNNKSHSQNGLGGNYKNYLRIILPMDVEKISVKQKNQTDPFYQPIDSREIDEESILSKKIFGFLVTVASREKREVVITYQRSEKINFKEPFFDYIIYLQKQPGIFADQLNYRFNYPKFLKPLKVMPSPEIKNQSLLFTSQWDRDQLYALEFSK